MNDEDVKQLRTVMGLSQQKFAEKLGVGIATVERWEKGVNRPSPLALEKLNRLRRAVGS